MNPPGRHDPATFARARLLAPPDEAARLLLGKVLTRRWQGEQLVGRIVETEAYFGTDDPAAHAFAGRTARNAVLWGPPGYAYVYFIYGLHACLNVSCEPEGQAGCVLIRALEPLTGLGAMSQLRNLGPDVAPKLLTSGPGRLCQALAITRENANGLDLFHPDGELTLSDDGYAPGAIGVSPRIGITKAAERPLRFFLADSECVTGRKAAKRANRAAGPPAASGQAQQRIVDQPRLPHPTGNRQ